MARLEEALRAGGVVHAQQEALWLLQAATELERGDLLLRQMPLPRDAEHKALELAQRRASGEPLQYVTGVAGFRYLELRVGPGVFIPRPETELVAERAMELLPRNGVLVDVGTGSGAIALSVATERPDAFVFATESSSRALEYATRNGRECDAAVEFFLCDLLTGLPERLRGAVDLCVSNPPYVPSSERRMLPTDVVEHEPHVALFGDEDGLGPIRRLVRDAHRWLRRDAWLVFEIGDRQGQAAQAILGEAGYRDTDVNRDLTGRERIAEGRM
ncbi:peptide chain release factor N(5)-glutamine methyltransferase [soil metagenome]